MAAIEKHNVLTNHGDRGSRRTLPDGTRLATFNIGGLYFRVFGHAQQKEGDRFYFAWPETHTVLFASNQADDPGMWIDLVRVQLHKVDALEPPTFVDAILDNSSDPRLEFTPRGDRLAEDTVNSDQASISVITKLRKARKIIASFIITPQPGAPAGNKNRRNAVPDWIIAEAETKRYKDKDTGTEYTSLEYFADALAQPKRYEVSATTIERALKRRKQPK